MYVSIFLVRTQYDFDYCFSRKDNPFGKGHLVVNVNSIESLLKVL